MSHCSDFDEMASDTLLIFDRIGGKGFGSVIDCFAMNEEVPYFIRVLGNGGLISGIALFWNRSYDIFRVYLNGLRQSDLVLVETN
jgi:hypothetical protein